jgi:hypothetical protein
VVVLSSFLLCGTHTGSFQAETPLILMFRFPEPTLFSGCASSPLMRRDCILEAGGYDDSLHDRNAQGCEDWKLLLAIAERHEFVVLPLPLTGYRKVPSSMSRSLWTMLRSYELVIAEVRRSHPEHPDQLYRWSHGRISGWLAAQAVRDGKYLDAMRLCAISVNNDRICVVEIAIHGVVKLVRCVCNVFTRRPRRLYPEGLTVLVPNLGRVPRLFEYRHRYVGRLLIRLLPEHFIHPDGECPGPCCKCAGAAD